MQQSKTKASKRSSHDLSHVRIIGGSMRGRKIAFSSGDGLRPTLDRIRETLFNWLTADIAGAVCLDLFAGSGALGFEAASRGAKSVTFVDASKQAVSDLKKNIESLNLTHAQAVNLKASDFISNNQQKYDLVFLDPPFDKEMLPSALESLKSHLHDSALVYVEQELSKQPPTYANHWEVIKSKKTSRFYYQLLAFRPIISE